MPALRKQMHSFVSSTEYAVGRQGQQSQMQSPLSPTLTQEAERYSAAYIINWVARDHSPQTMEYDTAPMERKYTEKVSMQFENE